MGARKIESGQDLKKGTEGALPAGVASPASAESPETQKLTYQVILRHLAKFRDGARALLDIFDSHVPEEAGTKESTPAPSDHVETRAEAAELEPETPLQLRIERHMATVDRALMQIRDLNPDRKRRAELPTDVREMIATKERTIYDIVGAELHFWAATIENSPLDKFDQTEQAWIRRIIRLANIIGVDAEHKEHLDFLQDWASHEHS
jgi:hypothetical protein